jgi:hypothetical protein
MNQSAKKLILCLTAAFFACFFTPGCVHDSGTATPNKSSTIDTDKDGIPNISDTDIDGDGIPNGTDTDVDGNGIPNGTDTDVDGDGIPNTTDTDIDGDGIPNTIDPDIDGDGVPNGIDTVDKDHISGIAIAMVDTVKFSLSVKSGPTAGTVSSDEAIDLDKVRKEIDDNGIALSTFSITDLSIVSAGADNFIQANASARIVIKVSYLDQSSAKVPILESAASEGLAGPILTVGDVAKGARLNNEIFASPGPGFAQFTALIKNTSVARTTAIIDVTFLDAPSQGNAELTLNLILKASGKKSL